MAYDTTVFPTIKKYVNEKGNAFTWKEIGIHFATLNSLVKRGYLSKKGDKYSLESKGIMFAKIESKTINCDYFSLKKPNSEIGMLCSIKGPNIYDAFDNEYELEDEVILRYLKPNSPQIIIRKEEE